MLKLHLIGQAPPKPPGPEFPFGRTKLYSWLSQIGLGDYTTFDVRNNWNKVLKSGEVLLAFDAIYLEFPGSNKNGHLVPTRKQILENKEYLTNSLKQIDADLIIPIGKLSIEYCLDSESFNGEKKKPNEVKMNDVIGQEFELNPYGLLSQNKKIIALPHPSGASTWFYKEGNMKLLENALRIIGNCIEKG